MSSFVIFFVALGVFIYTLVYCLRDAEDLSNPNDSVSSTEASVIVYDEEDSVVVDDEEDSVVVEEEEDSSANPEEDASTEDEVTEEVEVSGVPESETSKVPYGESIDDYSEEEQELLFDEVGIDVFDSVLGTIRLEGDDIIKVEGTNKGLDSYVGPIEWSGNHEFSYGSGKSKVNGFYDFEEDSLVINGVYFQRRR